MTYRTPKTDADPDVYEIYQLIVKNLRVDQTSQRNITSRRHSVTSHWSLRVYDTFYSYLFIVNVKSWIILFIVQSRARIQTVRAVSFVCEWVVKSSIKVAFRVMMN